jgi:hypothetical protein
MGVYVSMGHCYLVSDKLNQAIESVHAFFGSCVSVPIFKKHAMRLILSYETASQHYYVMAGVIFLEQSFTLMTVALQFAQKVDVTCFFHWGSP